jgi:hypothetical protein
MRSVTSSMLAIEQLGSCMAFEVGFESLDQRCVTLSPRRADCCAGMSDLAALAPTYSGGRQSAMSAARLARCRPSASKFSGASQRSKAARVAGHS